MRDLKRIKATYQVEAQDVKQAAWEIASGQSIGNPYMRTKYDSHELVKRHLPKIKVQGNLVTLGFPKCNFGKTDGMTHLLSVLMGGQMDIDHIKGCRLLDVDLSAIENRFPYPRYGIKGLRDKLGVYGRPLLCGIIKPKIGVSPHRVAEIALELAKGGVDIIKEDECLGNPHWCAFPERLKAVQRALHGYNVLYMPCITSDGWEVVRRARIAKTYGAGAIHLNIWGGFGAYRELRENVNLPIFFQKSGDKIWTTGAYSIDYAIICKIINMMGCDMAHIGMYGGYLSESVGEIQKRQQALKDTMPSFSCGSHPGLVGSLRKLFGDDIIITSGGSIHSHPMGTMAGAMAFRQAMNGYANPPQELSEAIKLWGVA